MPSLQELEEFKSSFIELGNERKTLDELGLPMDDLSLPTDEPEVIAVASGDSADTPQDTGQTEASSPADTEPEAAGGAFYDPDAPAVTEDTENDSDADLLNLSDLGDLLGDMGNQKDSGEVPADLPDTVGLNQLPDSPDSGSPLPEEDLGNLIDSIPDDLGQESSGMESSGLLDGLADEIESAAGQEDLSEAPSLEDAQSGEEEAPGGEPSDFDLGEMPDFGTDSDFDSATDDKDSFSVSGDDELSDSELPDFPDDDADSSAAAGDDVSSDVLPDISSADFGDQSVDISPDAFEPPLSDKPPDDLGDLDDFGDFAADDTSDTLDSSALDDLGDLGDFAADDSTDTLDSSALDDLGDLGDFAADDSTDTLDSAALDDLGDLGDFAADDSTDTLDNAALDDLGDLGDFAADDSTDTLDSAALDDLGDFAISDSEDQSPGGIDDDELADFSLPDGDLAASSADLSGDGNISADLDADDGFDMGGEAQNLDADALLEDIPDDSFGSFKLDSTSAGSKKGFGADDDDLGNLDDFAIPGADTVFAGRSAPLGKSSLRAAGEADPSGIETDEVEEINLTEKELEQLENTLSSFPLNLRIACEELIAEQVVTPDQLSKFIGLLVNGASAGETASLASKILGRSIAIPKGFEKKTGEALEAEQSSFGYIFVHNFIPVLRIFMMVAAVVFSVGYLCWRFIYTPLRAEKIYELGIERIQAGEYNRANERFVEAFGIHDKKSWFYTYARAFRDARQYTFAEQKYQELLNYTASKNKRGIPEKAAVLEYADLHTNYIGNYEEADKILRHNLLDYAPWDKEGLLALGDNNLQWGEYEPSRYENAREAFAMYMERYGRTDPLMERMLKYFISTDNLGEVLSLQRYFMASDKRQISSLTLAELGGYLLDKRTEEIRGVPNEYLDSIGGIRDILLRAVRQNSMLPESYYHLARYYNYFENSNDERLTLQLGLRVFDAAKEENPKRIKYHINALRRFAEIQINNREFFPAEENLVKAAALYENGLSRRLLNRAPEFGQVYAALGDLEYFVKDGDMSSALAYYHQAEENLWAPPEILYRMGAAHYQLRQWGPAQDRLYEAYRDSVPNRRILYALGNVSYIRGNYFAAQGYYDRLLEILEDNRFRLPPISATDNPIQLDLAERLMVAQNNMGVTLEALTERTGNNMYRSRARAYYADSERAWDVLTRNPQTMSRMRPSPEINAPGVNPAYLNVQNSLYPVSGYEPLFFLRIDKDLPEVSQWETLAPPGYQLSEGITSGR